MKNRAEELKRQAKEEIKRQEEGNLVKVFLESLGDEVKRVKTMNKRVRSYDWRG